ncbi:hypothetical protein [Streptomyces sp. NPDC001286]
MRSQVAHAAAVQGEAVGNLEGAGPFTQLAQDLLDPRQVLRGDPAEDVGEWVAPGTGQGVLPGEDLVALHPLVGQIEAENAGRPRPQAWSGFHGTSGPLHAGQIAVQQVHGFAQEGLLH